MNKTALKGAAYALYNFLQLSAPIKISVGDLADQIGYSTKTTWCAMAGLRRLDFIQVERKSRREPYTYSVRAQKTKE